jgi:hypothetical protein
VNLPRLVDGIGKVIDVAVCVHDPAARKVPLRLIALTRSTKDPETNTGIDVPLGEAKAVIVLMTDC